MTIASAAGIGAILHAEPYTTSGAAPDFLAAWVKAWNNHDAHALGELHTSNAVTVNRFGTLVVGREPTEKAWASATAPSAEELIKSSAWREGAAARAVPVTRKLRREVEEVIMLEAYRA
jgi:hypothetical protein